MKNSGGYFDISRISKESSELEEKLNAPDFWNNKEHAQSTVTRLSEIKTVITPFSKIDKEFIDFQEFYELLKEETDLEQENELIKELKEFNKHLVKLELKSKLSGKFDHCNAIVNVNAGAGGTESCDWAAMLIRMLQRWAEEHQYKADMIDILPGDEAGIKNATFIVKGKNAFGYLKSETGVHRLVRISPFDTNKRRHTSFVSIDVSAEIDDDITIELKEDDLKIDTYRSSGAGGQHVNTTDSAVRITHLPTGLVVASQEERSQHKNKATAMKILKSKIYAKIESEKQAEQSLEYGAKQEIGWGSQIRSYVFCPYQMVKDHRTSIETGNLQAVMDGDIDIFIEGYLQRS